MSVVPWSIVVGLAVGTSPTLADQLEPVWWVSAPTLNVIYPERVIGFDLKVVGYFILSVPDIPSGWSISITNDSSEEAEISGNSQVRVAAVEADYFRRFVAIQQFEPEYRPISATLELKIASDFKHERRRTVPFDQLVLSKESK